MSTLSPKPQCCAAPSAPSTQRFRPLKSQASAQTPTRNHTQEKRRRMPLQRNVAQATPRAARQNVLQSRIGRVRTDAPKPRRSAAATDELPVLLDDREHADDGRVVLARETMDKKQAGVDPAVRPDDDFTALGSVERQLLAHQPQA